MIYKSKTQARQCFPGEVFPGGNYLYLGTWYHLVKTYDGYTFVPRNGNDILSFGGFRI